MVDREKVIKGLEKCRRYECDNCTEKGASQAPWDCPVYDDFVDSALALLKEQEPVEPTLKQDNDGIFVWACGSCGAYMYHIYDGIDKAKEYAKYCRQCGRKVKWDDD